MNLFTTLFAAAAVAATASPSLKNISAVENGCVSFTVGSGTGCAWMCNYCAGALGTNNYYFTDGVCSYQTGGCVGSPQSGKQYTCCAAGFDSAEKEEQPIEEEYTIIYRMRWA
jgi:hypothetical protein